MNPVRFRHDNIFIGLALALLSSVVSIAVAAPQQTADTIYHHGIVLTMDAQTRMAEAVAIADGKVLLAGSNAEVSALAGPKTVKIDLQSRTLLPGESNA